MLPLSGMLFLVRFVRPPLLPLSQNGSKPTFTPRHTLLSFTHPGVPRGAELFSVPEYLDWLPVFVLLRLRVPFVLGRLSAIKVRLELELALNEFSIKRTYINKQMHFGAVATEPIRKEYVCLHSDNALVIISNPHQLEIYYVN